MLAPLNSLVGSFTLLGDLEDSFWFPKQASTFAEGVDWTYDLILYICILFFVPITIALFGFAIVYHKKKGQKADSQTSHHTPLELTWSIGPSIFLVWMFAQGAFAYLDMRTPPEGANEVGVNAKKWAWLMDYGRGTFHPELHILVDEPTKLSMRSDDVIHSLYIPAFRAKKDIVPGRYNFMWFQPTVANEKVSEEELAKALAEVGDKPWGVEEYDKYQFTRDGYRFYDLYCTEYCGMDHSEMQTVVVVHKTLEDLQAWIKANSARDENTSPEAWGERLYNQRGCKGCHSLDGSKMTGPSFADLDFGSQHKMVDGESVEIDANYVRESILNPKAKVVAGYNPVMPSFKGQLTDDDIDSLIAYIKTVAEAN